MRMKKTYYPRPEQVVKEGNINYMLRKSNFVHALSLIRKSCFDKVGIFDEELPAFEDWELYIRISEYFEFKYIDKPLNMHYLSDDSLSLKIQLQIVAIEKIVEKHFDTVKQKKEISEFYCQFALYLCLNGQLHYSRVYFMKAIKNNPVDTRSYFGIFTSIFGLKVFSTFFELRKRIVDN